MGNVKQSLRAGGASVKEQKFLEASWALHPALEDPQGPHQQHSSHHLGHKLCVGCHVTRTQALLRKQQKDGISLWTSEPDVTRVAAEPGPKSSDAPAAG